MRTGPLIVALLLSPQLGRAQVTVLTPGSTQGQNARTSDANYGPPRVAELDAILMDGYQRSHVITEGEVGPFLQAHDRYWILGRSGANVLLIPGRDFDASELDQVIGKRTEVRGIVRALREKEYVTVPGTRPGSTRQVDRDLVEDPTLPPLPPPNFTEGWPRISLTIFSIRDRTSPDFKGKKEKSGGISQQILDQPSAYSGKTTKIYGQYRGRNLFGDLPANSARGKEDWVIKDGDTAVWVMGKAPKGQGWKLDLDYKGDAKSWLEVEGKPEVMNGIVYLKASFVLMSKAPAGDKPEPARP